MNIYKNLKKDKNNNLLSYKKNVFSQNGEDGIIEAIFDSIGIMYKSCCEFGAWDGIHFSNCRKLILEGWTAIMIEGEEKRYSELCTNYVDNEKVIPINAYVDVDKNSFDLLLKNVNILDLDFLSIDIDGLDYDIFNTLNVRPRVICIEVNAGHSPDYDIVLDKEIAKNNI